VAPHAGPGRAGRSGAIFLSAPAQIARFQAIQVPVWAAVLLLIGLIVVGVILYKARNGHD